MYYYSTKLQPSGSHPHLISDYSQIEPVVGCDWYYSFNVPNQVIVDKYSIDDSYLHGPCDPEAGFYAVREEDIRHSETYLVGSVKGKSYDLALHLRYLFPGHNKVGLKRAVEIQAPKLFLACNSGSDSPKEASQQLTSCKPDSIQLGNTTVSDILAKGFDKTYETVYVPQFNNNGVSCAQALNATRSATLQVPIGALDDMPIVTGVTGVIVIFAFVVILFALFQDRSKPLDDTKKDE